MNSFSILFSFPFCFVDSLIYGGRFGKQEEIEENTLKNDSWSGGRTVLVLIIL